MKAGAAAVFAIAAAALAVGGCGGGGAHAIAIGRSRLPLVPGARVAAQATQCDKGANAFCALELLVVDRSFSSSGALVTREHQILRRSGWSQAVGATGDEQAAGTPDHGLQVVYATALGDLTGVDLKWIKRPRLFTLALSSAVFARLPAMSVILERGPA